MEAAVGQLTLLTSLRMSVDGSREASQSAELSTAAAAGPRHTGSERPPKLQLQLVGSRGTLIGCGGGGGGSVGSSMLQEITLERRGQLHDYELEVAAAAVPDLRYLKLSGATDGQPVASLLPQGTLQRVLFLSRLIVGIAMRFCCHIREQWTLHAEISNNVLDCEGLEPVIL